MNETGVYAHVDEDGFVFCSYDDSFEEVEVLEPPKDTVKSTLEYVEGRFFQEDGSDELIEDLVAEGGREDEPPRVGTLRYEDGEMVELEYDF